MEQLPQNVLVKIFSFLNSDDLTTLKEVRNDWNELIDTEIGVTAHCGAGNAVYWYEGQKWLSVDTISELGISKCYFSEVEELLPPTGFKYPHLIRELSFDGFIERTNFSLIIHQVSNTLRRLTLHTSTLCFLKSVQLKGWNLPALRELQIYCYGCTSESSWSYMDDCIIDNFTVILQNNFFPKLNCLKISMLFIAKREREITFSIISFLIKHAATLRHLRVEFRYEGFTNDEVGPDYTEELGLMLPFKLQMVKLQYFKLHFWFNGSPEFHRTWVDLLSQQESLATIVYVTGSGWSPFPVPIIRQNHETLVRLTIRMNLSNDFFDCSVFGNCHNLKRLCLMNKDQRRPKKSKKHCQTRTQWACAPILTRPTSLPKQIDTLFVSWIKIATTDIDLIYEHLSHLKEISFTFIGDHGVFGVGASTAAKFLQMKRLKRFTILHGFNSLPPARDPEIISNPYQFLVNMLLGAKYLYLDVIKNKHGFYDIIK